MANYGTYAALTDLKALIGETGTGNDSRLRAVLEEVSAYIDNYCKRHFGVRSETRTFTPVSSRYVIVDDLLSIATLKTDEDDDWDYDYTWATTDYHLIPFNSWPKWQIKVKSGGDYSFPLQEEGLQIAGLWGYGDESSATPYIDSGTTATVATTAGTAVTVASASGLAVCQTILVESEQMYVTAISGTTLTVVRGVNGTTAAVHAGKSLYIYQYPRPITEAALIQAVRGFRGTDAPFGVTGSPEMGVTQVLGALDPRARGKLDVYRREVIA